MKLFQFIGSKFSGLVSGFIGNWKIYTFAIVIFGGYIASLKFKNFNSNRKLNKAQIENKDLNYKMTLIELSNNAYKITQDELINANEECAQNNKANADKAVNAISNLEQSKNDIEQKYKELQDSHVSSVCGNTIIDVELLPKTTNTD